MTSQEYNLYKFFLEVIKALILIVVSVYAEKRFKVSRIFSLSIKKESRQQLRQGGKGNQAAASEDGDATNIKINAKDDAKVDITIGRKKDALDQPHIKENSLQLSDDAEFICSEFKEKFQKQGKIFGFKNDYAKAENYKKSKKIRASATLYIKIFNSISDFIEKDCNDYNTANEIKKQVELLNCWSLDGNSDNDFEEIIKNIERILFSFLQK